MILEYFSMALKFLISLISVTNPIGAIPVFLTLTRGLSTDDIKKISTSCALAVSVTTVVSLFLGHYVLAIFGISVSSFRVGGGILLMLMAINMINARPNNSKLTSDEIHASNKSNEIGIVPLAIPLLSGPGCISTCILKGEAILKSTQLNQYTQFILAIIDLIILGFIIKFILLFGRKIGRKLGEVGLNITSRIMGLIILALSIEFITGGLKSIFAIK